MWDKIQVHRDKVVAPVDELGASSLVKDYDPSDINTKAYHTLIGLMLSSQTKDEVTHSTLRSLVDDHSLSIQTILKTEEKDLNSWISKVGFHNRKAEYIKKTT